MAGKEDPLGQTGPQRKVTLWLDRENMLEARENYWQAFLASGAVPVHHPGDVVRPMTERQVWDIAFAAAVAASDFIFAGKVTP